MILLLRSLIVYGSHHHGNTKKLAAHLAACYDITLINAEETDAIPFASYDLIGFASGMDFGGFYPSVIRLALMLPPGKMVYSFYTCARDQAAYGLQIREIAEAAGCHFLGKFGCKGYNTYGPLKLIGGMNRHHPDSTDLQAASSFYEQILAAAAALLSAAQEA